MITSKPVTLREYRANDTSLLQQLRNDISTQLDLQSHPKPNTESSIINWVNSFASSLDSLLFVVADSETDRAVGFIQLKNINHLSHHACLGLAVSRAYRGCGYGSTALKLCENYAHSILGINMIYLYVLKSNTKAMRLYEKMDYDKVGTIKSYYKIDGCFFDSVLMQKLLAT